MSLWISLVAVRPVEVFEKNITHNLNEMAEKAGLYQAMWEPENLKITCAGDLIPILESGLERLENDPEYYKGFNPLNGWGSYEGLVNAVREYLEACMENPDAEVKTWK